MAAFKGVMLTPRGPPDVDVALTLAATILADGTVGVRTKILAYSTRPRTPPMPRPPSSPRGSPRDWLARKLAQEDLDECVPCSPSPRSPRPPPDGFLDIPRGTKAGLWTCCSQTAPNAPGCLYGPHEFDFKQCQQCARWFHDKEWASTEGDSGLAFDRTKLCCYHKNEPTMHLGGNVHFSCCGSWGLEGTKFAPDQKLRGYIEERNEMREVLMQQKHEAVKPSPRAKKILRHGIGSMIETLKYEDQFQRKGLSTGCKLGQHREVAPPEGIAKRCTGCGSEVLGPTCERCNATLRECRQCFMMVPVLDNGDMDNERSSPAAVAEQQGEAASNAPPRPGCRFHPGLFCPARRVRVAVRQRRDARACPYPGCGLMLPKLSEYEEHVTNQSHDVTYKPWMYGQCEYAPRDCPNNCGIEATLGRKLKQRELKAHLGGNISDGGPCPMQDVICPDGCGLVMKRHLIYNHVLTVCPSTVLTCPRGCGASVRRADLEEHRKVCPDEPVECTFGCGAAAPRKEHGDLGQWQLAHNATCPLHPEPCPICYRLIDHRKDVLQHQKTECPVHFVKCWRCEQFIPRAEVEAHERECIVEKAFFAWQGRVADVKERRARGESVRDDDNLDDRFGVGLDMALLITGGSVVDRVLGGGGGGRRGDLGGGRAANAFAPTAVPHPKDGTLHPALDKDAQLDGTGCGFYGCTFDLNFVQPRTLVRHRKLCPYRPLECPNRCGQHVAAYLMNAHVSGECGQADTPRGPFSKRALCFYDHLR